ncbi:retrovirus-related pol polyprotein from transposon TNT 1-94, partial [Tanacetum coccineum]
VYAWKDKEDRRILCITKHAKGMEQTKQVLYEDADEETTSGVWKNLKKIFENVKVKIDDEDVALILLVSFPPSFENFVNSFIVGKDTITLDYFDLFCIPESFVIKHQELKNLNLSAYLLQARIGIFVIIEKRKAIGGLIVLSLRKKVKAVVAKDDSSSERDVVSSVVYYKDLKKNLISLGVFDFKGFKYTIKNGVLRVSKGALVVMKATKGTYSLYTLQGETITSSASVSYSKKSNSDLTMLWHMRLGYVSEKGMVILSKRGKLDNNKVANLEFCEHCVIEKTKMNRISWAEALNTVCYLINMYPATAIDCKTPIEVWSGKPADYLKLRDYLFLIKQDPIKSKLEKGVFEKVDDVPKEVEHVVPGDTDHDGTSRDDHANSSHLKHEQDQSIPYESLELTTYREAITSKEYGMWIATMGKEIESIHKNNTWELVKL